MGNIMTCKINADTTDGLKLISDTSGEVDLQTNGTTKVHMDSSGNVGIGTSSPALPLHISSATPSIRLTDTDDNSDSQVGAAAGGLLVLDADINNEVAGTAILFRVDGGSEKMRINSSGQLFVTNASNFTDANNANLALNHTVGTRGMNIHTTGTGTSERITFQNDNGTVGNIATSGSATSYNTSSDYRLKENVTYTFDATTRLKQLRPCRFNWILDNTDTALDGFLAHEVSSIVPEAIIGAKDAVETWQEGEELPDGVSVGDNKLDDDGNTIPYYQGIDQSKLVPLLVKTIQELEARITALESE
jgi:hypothetical protein